MTEERKCRDCDTVLTVGQNTLESYVTKHKGICIPCKRKSNKLYKPLQVAKEGPAKKRGADPIVAFERC